MSFLEGSCHAFSHDSAIFSLSPEAVTFLIRKKCDNILISSRGGILNFTKVAVFSSTKDVVFLKNLTKKLEKLNNYYTNVCVID